MNVFKKIMSLAVILLPTLSFSMQAPQGKNVVLTLGLTDKDNIGLYNTLVTRTGLHKTAPDHYHVTVAWVQNVSPDDVKSLRAYLQNMLNRYIQNGITFYSGYAGRYLVGNRTENWCPVVLYPDSETSERLKEINKNLGVDLKNYNIKNGKNYQFLDDVKPANYAPHITLAKSDHIRDAKVDKAASIKMINQKIRNSHYSVVVK